MNAQSKDEITLQSKFEHSHTLKDLDEIKSHGIKEEIKEFIAPMIANRIQTGKIEKVLKEYAEKGFINEEDLPSKNQVSDLKRNQKRKESFIGTEGEFIQLIEKLNPDQLKNEMQAIIIGYNLIPDNFCLVFSSKQLLNNIPLQALSGAPKYLCLDGTYKLTVLGYPLIVIGTQDINHKFKLLGVALSRHERAQDYQFVLESIKSAVKEFYQYDWEVDFVMSDASNAIHTAVKSAFENSYIHGMCSVHFYRNVEKKIVSLLEKEDRSSMKEDIKFLENMHSKDLFNCALVLFEKKWAEKAEGFLDYFYENWINSQFDHWYRGSIPPGFSHTNNGIEGFNNGIKSKYTNWERLQLQDFFNLVEEMIKDQSEESSKNEFPRTINVSKDLWIKAQEMEDDDFLKEGNKTFYWCRRKDEKKKTKRRKVTKGIITKYSNIKRSKSFDVFKENCCIWEVNIEDRIMLSSCTCPQFLLYHICKHMIVALLKLEQISIPTEFSTKKAVEQKKKRGRIPNAEKN